MTAFKQQTLRGAQRHRQACSALCTFSGFSHSRHVLGMLSDTTQMGNPDISSLASAWLQGMPHQLRVAGLPC